MTQLHESFLTQELVPWIKQNLATTGSDRCGFSALEVRPGR